MTQEQINPDAADHHHTLAGSKALAGVRVLDVATFVAAPFCGTILGDFGAEVIKVEQPNGGDSLRAFGTPTECGDLLVWLSESRNKKTITLNLRTPEGAKILRELVARSDVLLENFRPGTMEKWGLGFEDLLHVNPKLVMLRISAYGQTGPKRNEPGFARIAHAFGGLSHLAGDENGPPVVPGSTSLADYISGLWGAIGVLMALYHIRKGGLGQCIDIGLYESVFRLLDEMVPAFAKFGVVRNRMGADTVNVAPHSHYQTADGAWIAIACTNDRMFQRLTEVMGRGELGICARYATSADRVAHRDEINNLVGSWVRSLRTDEVLRRCVEGGVPSGPVYSIADIFKDHQYAARGNIVEVDDPRIGKISIPSALPRMSGTPAVFQHTGRALGQDTSKILHDLLGLGAEAVANLRAQGVV